MEQQLVSIQHRDLKIPGLKKTYQFLHITDAHVILYDETETADRAAYAAPRVSAFAKDGVVSARRLEALWQTIRDRAEQLDAVLLTGDILDFPSELNLNYLKKMLEELPVPYVFVLGNHDWSYFNDYHTAYAKVVQRPKFSGWMGGNTFIHQQKIGEITFIGLDNTMELYEDGIAEAFADALAGEENVIVLQHIPFYTPTLHKDTAAYWGRDINIGGEGICKNENWQAVRKAVLAPESPVRAVITGHLHFDHQDLLENTVPQFVTANAADGSAALFTVHG